MPRFTIGLTIFLVLTCSAAAAPQARSPATANPTFSYLEFERLEYQWGDHHDLLHWDAQGWIGGDTHKAWIKTEGARRAGDELEEAELQVLYSRLLSPYFDWQAGLRYDFEPQPERAYAVLGIQGLAPYFFEIDAAAFLSEEGDLGLRFKGEYELLFTQRLIAQPSVEINASAQEVEELGLGSGINEIQAGLRLRYEIVREFAPYAGLEWSRKLGATADFARDAGENEEETRWVVGLRVWF